jgi:hypothetical protein
MFTSGNIFIHFLGYVFYHVLAVQCNGYVSSLYGRVHDNNVYSEVVQRDQFRSHFSSWSLLEASAILRQRKYEIYDMRTNEV